MTAVAAPYDDLLACDGGLTEAEVDSLDEQELLTLLSSRFRLYADAGHGPAEALLRAVGLPGDEAAFVARALTSGPSVLH
jgi:hypothetical protein